MARWPISDDQLRSMYAGGRANDAAKWYVRFWGRIFATGAAPRRMVTLSVRGRRTGREMRIPVVLTDLDGRWYLVSMLGECNWVKNVRAAQGVAAIAHGRTRTCSMVEVPVAARGRILQRYVRVAPGSRPHIPVAPGRPVEEFQEVADRYPVFELFADAPGTPVPFRPSRSWVPVGIGAALALGVAIARR